MTSPRRPRNGRSGPRKPDTFGSGEVITDTGSLLTALPGMIGFIPERSFILVALDDDHEVAVTMRNDLELRDDGSLHPAARSVLNQLGGVCERYGIATSILIIVDDRFPADDRRYAGVMSVANGALARAGGVQDGFVIADCREGGTWQRIWPVGHPADLRGVLGDPHSSPVAVAKAVRSGRRVLHRRSDMIEMLTEREHCDSISGDSDTCDAGIPIGIARTDKPSALIELIACAVGGLNEWDCETVRFLQAAILDHEIRDAALALSVTDHRSGAELLWRGLTCRLRGSGRASAATLLAHLHYVGGEGAYAGVALDCALDADPDWNLANLLDQALRNGLRPTETVGILDSSYRAAADLGVELPPWTMEVAG